MCYSIRLTWKTFARMDAGVAPYALGTSPLFNVRTSITLLSTVGGNVRPDFYPLSLEPTSVFFEGFRAERDRLDIGRKKPPYRVPLDRPLVANAVPDGSSAPDGKVVVNATLHAYGRTLCLTLDTEPFDVPDLDDVASLQLLESHPSLHGLALAWLSKAARRDHRAPPRSGPIKVFPCILISAASDSAPVGDGPLVSLLTRHEGIDVDGGALAEVNGKNAKHNQIDKTRILLDRQGIVAYVPPGASAGQRHGHLRRFLSCTAMLELAWAMQQSYLDRQPDEALIQRSARLATLPSTTTIPNSTSAQHAWTLLKKEFNLEALYGQAMENILTTTASKPPAEDVQKGSVLCVAAASVEADAILEALAEKFEPMKDLRFGADTAARFHDAANGVTWNIVVQSFQGQVEAGMVTARAVARLDPTIVLMVGMCMGMPAAELEKGTVVVPNEVFTFDHRRVTKDKTIYRPHGDDVADALYKQAQLVPKKALSYKVVTMKGLATSSAKIEDPDADLIGKLAEHFPDVVAVDMEGFAFYDAVGRLPALWVKAVADGGEAPAPGAAGQAKKHETQGSAVNNAIDFAIRVATAYFAAEEQ